MKVLTIKEPYASLIVNCIKEYEFRSWKTKYRGKILIHAGKSIDKESILKYKCYNLDYSFGYIIGEVYITDCILVNEKFSKELLTKNKLVYGNNSHIGEYAWKLTNAKKYINKIKCNGKLSLWNYEGK